MKTPSILPQILVLVAVFACGSLLGAWGWQATSGSSLQAQLAEKEALMAALSGDISTLRSELGHLKDSNAALLASVEASLSDASAIAKSNRSSLEKLRAVIQRLEALRKAIED